MDENLTRTHVPRGDYMVRTGTSSGDTVEMLATVEPRNATEVDSENNRAR